jgi:hypothetical protein
MGLTMSQRRAVTKAIATRYKRADQSGKGVILDELCAMTGLVGDCGALDPALLIRATQRIRKRVDGPVVHRAISHVAAGRPDAAITALLPHFDAAYRHRSGLLARPVLARVEVGDRSASGMGVAC